MIIIKVILTDFYFDTYFKGSEIVDHFILPVELVGSRASYAANMSVALTLQDNYSKFLTNITVKKTSLQRILIPSHYSLELEVDMRLYSPVK